LGLSVAKSEPPFVPSIGTRQMLQATADSPFVLARSWFCLPRCHRSDARSDLSPSRRLRFAKICHRGEATVATHAKSNLSQLTPTALDLFANSTFLQ
jgi:hypothetical protein